VRLHPARESRGFAPARRGFAGCAARGAAKVGKRAGLRQRSVHSGSLERQSAETLRLALRRRGWRWRRRQTDALLLPRSEAARSRFFAALHRYSFRLFVRDVIAHGDDFALADLTRYCSPAVARRYLDLLVDVRLVRRHRTSFRLADPSVSSFGPTLEWFVARVLRAEFDIPCAANVRLEGGDAGGDFDVVGFLEGTLLYVEVKSSPPRNIEVRQARAFCRRLASLAPGIAIFANDTQLHMAPKILPLLRRAYRTAFGSCRVECLADEVYLLGRHVYLANSDPDLVGNIERCLAHWLRHGGGARW